MWLLGGHSGPLPGSLPPPPPLLLGATGPLLLTFRPCDSTPRNPELVDVDVDDDDGGSCTYNSTDGLALELEFLEFSTEIVAVVAQLLTSSGGDDNEDAITVDFRGDDVSAVSEHERRSPTSMAQQLPALLRIGLGC